MSFIERAMAAHRVKKAKEDMAGTFFQWYIDADAYKLQPPSNSVVKLPSDTRSDIEHVLVDLSVLPKTDTGAIDTGAIVKSSLSKWTITLQLKIVKVPESIFEDTLQATYIHSNNAPNLLC